MATKAKKGKGSASKHKVSNVNKDMSIEELKDEELEALEKEGSFAWQLLKRAKIKSLLQMSPEQVMEAIARLMGLDTWEKDWGSGAVLDCYVLSFYWAVQKSFDHRQISAIFTLVDKVLKLIKDGSSLFEVTSFLMEVLQGVSVASVLSLDALNPETTETDAPQTFSPLDCISAEQAKQTMDFVTETILQHYQLYSYVFSETQPEELTSTEYSIQILPESSLPFPCPLDEAMAEEVFNTYVLTPPASPVPEEVADDSARDAEGSAVEGETGADDDLDITQKEDEILAELTVDQIRTIVNKLAAQEIGSFQDEYHSKLRERETTYLQKITKLARTVDN